MTAGILRVAKIERQLSMGGSETLQFEDGVNVVVGRPNTGKTRWLQTLDYLLGDSGNSPFEQSDDEHLALKYAAAGVDLLVAGEAIKIERKWNEPGARSKVFVNGVPMGAQDFQLLLLEKLNIPLVHFPKGNPYSGQTWPQLSFRMLLRHLYRRQRFWNDLADLQPEGEQHACLLQFLGLAQNVFSEEYGELIRLRSEATKLKARREQYELTLAQLAGDVLTDGKSNGSISLPGVKEAERRLEDHAAQLRDKRLSILEAARTKVVPAEHRSRTAELGEKRATLVIGIEELQRRAKAVEERSAEMRAYKDTLLAEIDRINRVADAGEVLADIRVTHCPACDQPVDQKVNSHECFLCHQDLPHGPALEHLGTARLKFEGDRLKAELDEAVQLIDVLSRDRARISKQLLELNQTLKDGR